MMSGVGFFGPMPIPSLVCNYGPNVKSNGSAPFRTCVPVTTLLHLRRLFVDVRKNNARFQMQNYSSGPRRMKFEQPGYHPSLHAVRKAGCRTRCSNDRFKHAAPGPPALVFLACTPNGPPDCLLRALPLLQPDRQDCS